MIQLTLIANAGLLIQFENIRLLLDGIQREGDYPFSKTPLPILEQMLTAALHGRYNDIDYLIFSHMHPDHFSPALTSEYIKNNHVKRLLFPQTDSEQSETLSAALSATKTPYWNFEMTRGKIHRYKLAENITLASLCTRHMPQLFADDLCNALLLTIMEKNLLFLTDCSCLERELFSHLSDFDIHIVFLNPYFFHDSQGRHILNHYIRPEKTVVYHIPFPEDDKLHIRSLINQDKKKYPEYDIVLMDEPHFTISV